MKKYGVNYIITDIDWAEPFIKAGIVSYYRPKRVYNPIVVIAAKGVNKNTLAKIAFENEGRYLKERHEKNG